MRILLSTIGSRGDVEPLLALALELRALDQDVRICAPPDFRNWIDSFGVPVVPLGPELRSFLAGSTPLRSARPSPERLRQLAEESVTIQFATITAAAQGCDVLLAVGGTQIAARSVSEIQGSRYAYAAYCPITLPSPHHPPLLLLARGEQPPGEASDYRALWAQDAAWWNDIFGGALNTQRAAAGLPPVSDVRSHIFTCHPWLAADPALAPWSASEDLPVLQTGAWIRPDARPLSPELEAFLDAGEPPVYFGFGSMPAPADLSRVMVEAARALRRRAVVSRGWAGLSLPDDGDDCISIGETNQQALFRRVAAVVHHGGAGTTTVAARAAAPQVVIPQNYDQFYWAERVQQLGIGSAHPRVLPDVVSLATALSRALQPAVRARAQSIAAEVRTDGVRAAAQQLLGLTAAQSS